MRIITFKPCLAEKRVCVCNAPSVLLGMWGMECLSNPNSRVRFYDMDRGLHLKVPQSPKLCSD